MIRVKITYLLPEGEGWVSKWFKDGDCMLVTMIECTLDMVPSDFIKIKAITFD